MKKPFRLIAALLLAACAAHPAGAMAADKNYVTMQELREQCREGWHQQYSYKGHDVDVDIDYCFPEVDKAPVLSVVAFNAELASWNPDMDITRCDDENGGYVLLSKKDVSKWLGDTNQGGSFKLDYHQGVDAENNDLTFWEALERAEEIIAPYREWYGLDLRYEDSAVYSVAYKHSDWKTDTYWDPKSEAGHYDFSYQQVFHDIPWLLEYIPLNLPYPWRGKIEDLPLGRIDVSVFDSEVYWLLMEPGVETEVLADDIPLAPIAKVQRSMEKLVQEGYVRSVNKVSFGYVMMLDPQKRMDRHALFPAWVLDGIVVENPDKPGPLPEYTEDELALKRIYGGDQKAVINAQTGEYFDPWDGSPERDVAKWLTWDEVGGK